MSNKKEQGFSYERVINENSSEADQLWWLVHIVLVTGACNDFMYDKIMQILRKPSK